MHPRNRYNVKPEFGELAKFHPPLEPYLIQKGKSKSAEGPTPSKEGISPEKPPIAQQFPYTIDFSNPLALRELTLAVMGKDFGLDVILPVDKLIPAVPQRLNYIHWIEDLLKLCDDVNCVGGTGTETNCVGGTGTETNCGGGNGTETNCGNGMETAADSHTIGIDIGTGASCIYPLLGTRLNGWSFLATDIDKESVAVAKENVLRNGLADKVKVMEVSPDVVLREVVDSTVSQYAFCMCNPPFFKDTDERLGGVASRSGRRPAAETFSSATTGEAVTSGGEKEFVSRIIQDSLQLRSRVRWYTAMLGKKASLKPLKALLKQNNVPVVTSTEFMQGRTWRWGLGWCFEPALQEKVDALNASIRKRKARPLTLQLPLHQLLSSVTPAPSGEESVQFVREWLVRRLEELEMKVTETESGSTAAVELTCHAIKNTWSHQRKRKRITDRLERHIKEAAIAHITQTEETVRRDLSIEELECKTKAELDALSTPCNVQFTCSIVPGNIHGGMEASSKKKRKLIPVQSCKGPSSEAAGTSSVTSGGETELCAQLNWVEGDDKDTLHQILQHLSNKL